MNELEDFNYEQSVARLEEIINTMEKGDIPLDDSLKLFEEGIRLYRICKECLAGAQRKITEIVKVEDQYKEVEFDKAGEDDSDI